MIIGLSGKALVGKDTVADYLLDRYGWNRKVSFAHNLKTSCSILFGLTWEQVSTQDGKKTPLDKPVVVTEHEIRSVIEWMRKTHTVNLNDKDYSHLLGVELETPRDILQFVGTDIMRYYVDDYHCEVVFKKLDTQDKVVITDVRFPNEAVKVLESGGYLIRIERPLILREIYGAVPNTAHYSEIALDDWDNWSYRLKNDGEHLSNLYSIVDEMVVSLEVNNDTDHKKA